MTASLDSISPWRTTLIFLLFITKSLAVIHAVEPSCVTDASGSTTCNVGINSVPTFGSIDGGYQWITQEVDTTTVSGLLTTQTIGVFTATQTNFLDVIPMTTTDSVGAPTTTIETQYVSFITALPTLNGAVLDAVIAGVIIAPALVVALQGVADVAVGKTVQQIAQEISDAFALQKAMLTPGDLQALAMYIFNLVAIAGVIVAIQPLMTGATVPLSAASSLSISITSGSSSSSSSTANATANVTGTAGGIISLTSIGPTVTAIMKPPYSDWAGISMGIMFLPSTGDLSSSSTSTTAIPSCTGGVIGVDPSIANKLAAAFCTSNSINFTQDASETISGSDLNPPIDSSGVSIQFSFSNSADTCALDLFASVSCVATYSLLIQNCQYNDHTINGAASVVEACGTYAFTLSSTTTAVTSSTSAPPPPRPVVSEVCADHNTNQPFTRSDALEVISKFCSYQGGITLKSPAGNTITASNTYGNTVINLAIGWSMSGQQGCAPLSTDVVSNADCNFYFGAAMDNCDTNTQTAKYGSTPLTWSSPIGCIDFNLYGSAAS